MQRIHRPATRAPREHAKAGAAGLPHHIARRRGGGDCLARSCADSVAVERRLGAVATDSPCVEAYFSSKEVELPPAAVPLVSVTVLISEFSDRYLWY